MLIAAPLSCVADSGSSGARSQAAPADEYFGRLGESVLGIRNSLDSIDQKSDSDMLSPDTLANLDDQPDAVVSLEQKYPNDPWLPRFLSRLSSDYARAGESSTPRAQVVADLLDGPYRSAPVAHTSNAVLGSVVADTDLPNLPELPDSNAASQAWGTYNSGRNIATIAGDVVDESTGAPLYGCRVAVSPNGYPDDTTDAARGNTDADGSFSIADVPLSSTEYVVVMPPAGSSYAPYTGVVDASEGVALNGVIRLHTN
jgi:hypothetical protein